MPFTWKFYTGEFSPALPERRCYRGPMIYVGWRMSRPWTVYPRQDHLRFLLLNSVTGSELKAVQTREVVLRVMNNILAPIFARLYPQKKGLQATICEKRSATLIENDLAQYQRKYMDLLRMLPPLQVPVQQKELLRNALESSNPALRVAGKCALVLLVSYMQMDLDNA